MMTRMLRNTLLASALVAVGACTTEKKAPATADSSAAVNATATPPAGTTTPATTTTTTTTTATTATTTSGALLDPNSATKEQLVAVAGMTPAAADALIAGRPYADMIAVDKALSSSLDAGARKTVYAQLFKPVDINKASKAEITLIPGVGNKMHHEFEEYRPWTSTEQFDREIGKYVDKAEVARLKRYISIK
jgi:DNA uptake protein ComE-like DNA-binding protein